MLNGIKHWLKCQRAHWEFKYANLCQYGPRLFRHKRDCPCYWCYL